MLNTDQIRTNLTGVIAFIGVVWGVHLLDIVLPLQEWTGLVPRDMQGLLGIVTMTFLHVDFPHLIGNTVPLVVLLSLLAGSRKNPWATTAAIAILGGTLLWIFGRNGGDGIVQLHVGASLLIYGLVTYLIAIGLFEREPVSIIIAIVVGVLYGGSTLAGVIPSSEGLSWDGHLAGAVAGIAVAFFRA